MKNRLPKYLQKIVESIDVEGGLVDGCKYMIYMKDEYSHNELIGSCYPVRNYKEALEILRDVSSEFEEIK